MPQTSRSARHRDYAAICAHIHGISAAALGDPCRFRVLGGTRRSQKLRRSCATGRHGRPRQSSCLSPRPPRHPAANASDGPAHCSGHEHLHVLDAARHHRPGDVDANLRANAQAREPFRLFNADSRFDRATSLHVRAGVDPGAAVRRRGRHDPEPAERAEDALFTRTTGFLRSTGVRGDARLQVLRGGISLRRVRRLLKPTTSSHPACSRDSTDGAPIDRSDSSGNTSHDRSSRGSEGRGWC